MQLNGLNNFFIYPGQKLKVPGKGGSSSSSASNLVQMVVITHQYFTIKTYILGDNVLGTYLIDVLK